MIQLVAFFLHWIQYILFSLLWLFEWGVWILPPLQIFYTTIDDNTFQQQNSNVLVCAGVHTCFTLSKLKVCCVWSKPNIVSENGDDGSGSTHLAVVMANNHFDRICHLGGLVDDATVNGAEIWIRRRMWCRIELMLLIDTCWQRI